MTDFSLIQGNLERHGFVVRSFATAMMVKDYLVAELHKETIAFGGSVTLRDMALYEALQADNVVVWHNRINGADVKRLASCVKVYITSANGVSETGELVNIDMIGNRVAMTAFGPAVTYYIIGRNKIRPTLAEAMDRAKNIAAPLNARRVGAKTPCAVKADRCYDCDSPGRLCRVTAIIERPPTGMRCEVLLVDEELGY